MEDEPMKSYERKLLNKRDGIIVAGILLTALFWILLSGLKTGTGNEEAVIVCGKQEIARLALSEDGEYTFPQIADMVFRVHDGAIAVTDSRCGDLTCVRTGPISSHGQAIVCVPNRVSVTVEGSGGDDLDVVLK